MDLKVTQSRNGRKYFYLPSPGFTGSRGGRSDAKGSLPENSQLALPQSTDDLDGAHNHMISDRSSVCNRR